MILGHHFTEKYTHLENLHKVVPYLALSEVLLKLSDTHNVDEPQTVLLGLVVTCSGI